MICERVAARKHIAMQCGQRAEEAVPIGGMGSGYRRQLLRVDLRRIMQCQ
jgi:hypothetical protein